MFFKIDKFGVARPVLFPFALFDDTSSTQSSDECVMYPKNSKCQPRCYDDEFTKYSDLVGFTDFKNEWSSSEFTVTSDSSISSKRSAINIMLTRDVFGYGTKRNELQKDTESLMQFYVSSSDSSPPYCGETMNFSSFDFIDDSFEDSLIKVEEKLTNVNVITLNDELKSVSSQIQTLETLFENSPSILCHRQAATLLSQFQVGGRLQNRLPLSERLQLSKFQAMKDRQVR